MSRECPGCSATISMRGGRNAGWHSGLRCLCEMKSMLSNGSVLGRQVLHWLLSTENLCPICHRHCSSSGCGDRINGVSRVCDAWVRICTEGGFIMWKEKCDAISAATSSGRGNLSLQEQAGITLVTLSLVPFLGTFRFLEHRRWKKRLFEAGNESWSTGAPGLPEGWGCPRG